MPQSLSKNYIHIVFSTKGRANLLPKAHLNEIHLYMKGILDSNNCKAICVGGVENHVHVLCVLSRTMTLSDLLRILKSNSSLWLNKNWATLHGRMDMVLFPLVSRRCLRLLNISRIKNIIILRETLRMNTLHYLMLMASLTTKDISGNKHVFAQ